MCQESSTVVYNRNSQTVLFIIYSSFSSQRTGTTKVHFSSLSWLMYKRTNLLIVLFQRRLICSAYMFLHYMIVFENDIKVHRCIFFLLFVWQNLVWKFIDANYSTYKYGSLSGPEIGILYVTLLSEKYLCKSGRFIKIKQEQKN